jgi:hypothetical protein
MSFGPLPHSAWRKFEVTLGVRLQALPFQRRMSPPSVDAQTSLMPELVLVEDALAHATPGEGGNQAKRAALTEPFEAQLLSDVPSSR